MSTDFRVEGVKGSVKYELVQRFWFVALLGNMSNSVYLHLKVCKIIALDL